FPIEAVYELQAGVRARRPERVDEADTKAGPAVDGKPRRLVEDQEPLLLVKDGVLHPAGGFRGDHGGRGLGATGMGGNTDAVAGSQAVAGGNAGAVHPDLAAADHPVDTAPGHVPEPAQQEIVQAPVRFRCPDLDVRGTAFVICFQRHTEMFSALPHYMSCCYSSAATK